MSSNYELEKAKLILEEAKDDIYKYFVKTYANTEKTSKDAKSTYKYLEKVVDDIYKRKEMSLKFSKGGSPLWYLNLFTKLATWIKAEYILNEVLNEELDNILE
jgi:hypothetical protein